MKKNLFWYKVGLGIIGLFVIGLSVFVVMQASGTKQDAQNDKKANSIADKLNSYITDHQTIPQSLSDAGVTGIPATITYQKLDTSSYKFCVTYKNNSSGFDATSAVIDAASGTSVDTSSDGLNQSYTKYSLYIDPTHHKGANCQTIKPIIYQSNPSICNVTYSSSSAIACPATLSNPSHTCEGISSDTSSCLQSQCNTGFGYSWSALSVKSIIAASAGKNAMITVDSYPTATTFQLKSDVKFFDTNCNPISLTSIHAGDFVTLYYSGDSENSPVVMITKGT